VLHKTGIVHFDVKPANMVLTADDNLVIIDFGLARIFAMDGPEAPKPGDFPLWHRLKDDGTDAFPLLWNTPDNPHTVDSPGGTRGYVSPAALLGRCSYGTDLYAVGVTLHRLLTGQVSHSPLRLFLSLCHSHRSARG
jgi:serine/threonine protein kinase